MNIRFVEVLLLIFLSLTFVSLCHAQLPSGSGADTRALEQQLQNMDAAQLSRINIDDISDAQLQAMLLRMQDAGYTLSDVELAMRARGMSEVQVQKLKTRLQKLGTNPAKRGAKAGVDRMRYDNSAPERNDDWLITGKDLEIQEEDNDNIALRRQIFGYHIFNSEALTFEPNLNIPTPANYQLGPGDEIIIDVWGASEQTYMESISPDGYIKIPALGMIYLNGMTMEQASERVISRLSEIYSGLRGSSPNTYAQVSLGQVRTIKVHVIGEAVRPGSFDVSSLSKVSHVLYLSNGPNVNGSLRAIDVIRDDSVLATIDIYNFLIGGKLNNNITLRDNDIVRIRPYIGRVEVNGEVKRTGIYEVKEGETFADLLTFAGGFTENAYKARIKVRRNTGSQKEFLDVSEENYGDRPVLNGDEILVEGILDRYANRVQIKGAVFREGEYELTDGLTVAGLIEKAQGLRGDAFMERATVYRSEPDYTYSVQSFNLRDILKNTENDVALQREDIVHISSIYDLSDELYVKIYGEVKSAGSYPFYESMTVEDLIIQAQGLRESASGSQIEIARRNDAGEKSPNNIAEIFVISIDKNLGMSPTDQRFVLQPFDYVFVRKAPGYQPQVTVKVEGEARYPGEYALEKKDERISNLLKRSGGLTEEAFPSGATLIRRTEFNLPVADEKQRMQNLVSILEDMEKEQEKNLYVTGSEAQILQEQRLREIREALASYSEAMGNADIGREGLRIRRQRLEQLIQRNSLSQETNPEQYQYETIGIELDKIIASPGSKFDLILQDGDILSIPRELETVRLRGEFLYPITVRYDGSLTFKNYVSRAGGFTDEARRRKSYVLYANGSVDRTTKFLFWNDYPPIEPGAEIIAPPKPERRGLSTGEVVALTSALATLALTIANIMR